MKACPLQRRCLLVQVRRLSFHSVATMPAIAPEVQATTKAAGELVVERKSPKFSQLGESIAPIPTGGGCGDRSPVCQEILGRGFIIERQHPLQRLLPYTRIRSHPVGDANSQFSGSDGMFKKSITGGSP